MAATATTNHLTTWVEVRKSTFRSAEERVNQISDKQLLENIIVVGGIENGFMPTDPVAVNVLKLFSKELELKQDIVSRLDFKTLLFLFSHISFEFLNKKVTSLSVEITSENSLFMLGKRGAKSVHWEAFFDEESGQLVNIFITIWDKKELVLSTNGTHAEILREIEEALPPLLNYSIKPNDMWNGLSGTNFTTATF